MKKVFTLILFVFVVSASFATGGNSTAEVDNERDNCYYKRVWTVTWVGFVPVPTSYEVEVCE